jgi:hypothetical protein
MHSALLLFALGAFFGGLIVHEMSKRPTRRPRSMPNSERVAALLKRREADKLRQAQYRI